MIYLERVKNGYCKWYCTEYLEYRTWLFQSSCGCSEKAKIGSSLYKMLYDNNNEHICPKCGKIITLGALMD